MRTSWQAAQCVTVQWRAYRLHVVWCRFKLANRFIRRPVQLWGLPLRTRGSQL